MSPGLKGLLVAVLLSLVFICGGYYLRQQFHAVEENHSKEIINQMETQGAIDFELKNLAGNPVSLSDYKGYVTVVNFWATWCEPCIEEFPSMIKLLEHFDGQVKMIAIAMDEDKKDVENFINAFQVRNKDLIVLWNPDQEFAKSWSTVKLPESYILDKEHKLVKKVASSENWATELVFKYFEDLIK